LIELEYHHCFGRVAILASDIPPLNLVLAAQLPERHGVERV
jgi:hypothetical protein